MKRLVSLTWILGLALAVACLQSLPALASAEGSFDRTLQVSGAVNLDVTTGSGSIQVRTGDSKEVRVTGRIKVTSWFDSSAEEKVKKIEANPPIQQNGNDIRIGRLDDPELRHNVSISYEIVVPADTRLHSQTGSGSQTVEGIHGSAEVETGSGGIKISDIGDTVRAQTGSGGIEIDRVKASVRARTGSGSIHASGIAGGFEGNTGSGHITLEQTAPGSVRADTGSGGMDLHGVHGLLEARAGSGSIEADGDPKGSWTVHTGSGGVHLRLPADAAFDLNARTSSGSISLNHPVTVEGTIGRREIRGKVHGGGIPVDVETGSGNIEIQ